MPFDRRHFLTACGALGAAVSLPARAQDAWPSKPIKLILPYAAGGPTDVVARAVAVYVRNAVGHIVVVG